ncbi:alpha/beta hydrolase family protein [Staphylococcus felis]|uniref:Glycosyl transferase n=1 Tax=Staphylococcus felis TaxID=46127 RepID=A0A3E0IQT0_9STAP|nr:glycosyl transferase [Staphylococcus felis]REH78032.1 glycosyl transferase [Staphylococcus felis]REH97470.1 glycosyl transferase [Staphylococcus felis]REI35083.1 glycosyl transferase [Staphylococcus felis]UXR86131.1 glycosyl transferase [Staphylococcus felis]
MIKLSFDKLTLEALMNTNNNKIQLIKDNLDFYIYINIKNKSDKLLVHSNGAIDLKKSKPPVFLRNSWKDEIDASCIFLDDRTIHNSPLNLAWGIGNPDRHYIKDYSEIIKKIATLLNIDDSNITYYGSSGGGFISIMLSTLHKKSKAIVNNPQTFVHRYSKNTIEKVYGFIFPGLTIDEVNRKYAERLSTTALMKTVKNVPEIFYIQNRLSENDMKQHYYPFLQMMDKYNMDTSSIKLILYNDKKAGHNPISKDKTLELINGIINNNITIY